MSQVNTVSVAMSSSPVVMADTTTQICKIFLLNLYTYNIIKSS